MSRQQSTSEVKLIEKREGERGGGREEGRKKKTQCPCSFILLIISTDQYVVGVAASLGFVCVCV